MANDFYQRNVWLQRNGQAIYVHDMSLQHLDNTIAMLKRNAWGIHDARVARMVRIGDGPLGPHGDWANDMFDQELDRLIDADPWEWLKSTPLVKAMRKARKRKIAALGESSWRARDDA